jgi:histidyl-tRNA synthetase
MSKIKAGLPKGTRDYLPQIKARRTYITNTIKSVYERFGFAEIETPAMENMDTLTGKYGDEGDKLLFRILNSGDYLKKADKDALKEEDSRKLAPSISEKGLHYDLTVPLARFVAMHQNDITFPFRRYQIQPVWRADRPQRGRYREFYQCDADVIGSDSLWNEIDLIKIFSQVFKRLNIDVTIKINNRKILAAIADKYGIRDRLTDFTVTLDKADKIGTEKVAAELLDAGFPKDLTEGLQQFVWTKGDNESRLQSLQQHLSNETGQLGVSELKFLFDHLDLPNLELDPGLARGLDYYTGTIFEVVAKNVQIGTIASGGRYDNLTEMFGMKDMTGVGISFGLDRIYDVLEELGGFPPTAEQGTEVLFVHFDNNTAATVQPYLDKLRSGGIKAELYPDPVKLKKQFKYADDKGILHVLIAGPEEMEQGIVSWKRMKTGEQSEVTFEQAIERIMDSKKPWE